MDIMKPKNSEPWRAYEYACKAARELNGAAFKLYIYLSYWPEDIAVSFSYSSFARNCGGGLTSARRAMAELMEKGYIQQVADELFYFYL